MANEKSSKADNGQSSDKAEESLCSREDSNEFNVEKNEWKSITNFTPRKKNIYNKYAVAIIITTLLVTLILQIKIRPVVVVSLNKASIAIVPNKKSFEGALSKLQNKWKNVYKKDIRIKGELSYKMRLLPSNAIASEKQVAEAIEAHTDSLVKVKAITVDGEAKAIVKDNDTAQIVLNSIKLKFDSKQERNAQFSEDVKIADIYVMPEMIQSEQGAVSMLLTSVNTVKEYTVKRGDTLWEIADNNNMLVEKLAEINTDIGDCLKPGQVIRLVAPKSIVNVKTIEYTQIKEDTPYETKFESDPNRVKGERKVLAYGTIGKKLYKIQIVKQNGVEVSRTVLNEQLIQEAKTEVIAIGTKANVAKTGTGAFKVPVFGSITSRFGYRWGSVHEGVDISGKMGQPIYAADGGKIIFSGVESGYGNLVKIGHGNGLVTYYGHCSKLLVKVGQSVSKGDQIALIGSTGHSTGPHLHFEVRKNGVPTDPMKYLK
ncbi:MAG TPA: metalloendopeptidase [Lachnospiraceae bacterium]|nr:metalloendopeptidase [Lachnospiraceae bacterium]